MVALHSEFIAGSLFLLSAVLLRPHRLLDAGVLAAGVALGPLLHTKPAYSGAWLGCLLPLLERRAAVGGAGGGWSGGWGGASFGAFDWLPQLLPLAASCLWSAGLLALAYDDQRGDVGFEGNNNWASRAVCGLCWLSSLATAAIVLPTAGAWAEAARLAQCSAVAMYMQRHLSGSLSPVELLLCAQLLRHLFPAFPLACYCLSAGLVATDALCRHCLATENAPRSIRFTRRGFAVAALQICAFGYYALTARLFRPATVARKLAALLQLATTEWRLVSIWLALFCLSLLLAGGSSRLPLGQMTQRKLFHFLAAAVFAVGIQGCCGGGRGELQSRERSRELLSAASAVLLAVFLGIDALRRHDAAGVGRRLRGLLAGLMGPRDSAHLLLTPLALLVGLAAPIWLEEAAGRGWDLGLAPWSGVLSVGLGDSLAALIGSRFGRLRWPQMRRTLEGSGASLVGQLAVVRLLLGGPALTVAALPVFSVVLVEAFLAQVDNLVLPLCLYYLLMA